MDLNNPNNWSVVFEGIPEPDPTNILRNYRDRLSYFKPLTFSLGSPIAIISTELETTRRWNIGAYFRASQVIAGVKTQVYWRKCLLNKSTFVNIPYSGFIPYEVEIAFPHWIAGAMRVTARQFTDQAGRYLPVSDQVLYSAVEVLDQRLRNRVLDLQIVRDDNPAP